MNALKRYTLAALAAALFAGPAHAGIVGDSSDHSNVKVGASIVDAVDPNDPTKKHCCPINIHENSRAVWLGETGGSGGSPLSNSSKSLRSNKLSCNSRSIC